MVRLARSCTLALTLVLAPVVGAAGASAVPPFDLPDELVDEQGALADPEAVRAAQDALASETGRQLFVVVVDDLDRAEATEWLEETAALSGLGEQDLALVVTTAGPGQPVSGTLRAPAASGLDAAASRRVQQDVDAAASGGDVDAVVEAALTGVRQAVVGGQDRPDRTWWVPAVLLLAIVTVAVAVAALLRRRARADAAARAADRAEELSGTLGSLVVALDQQLAEARLELDLAAARVHDDATATTLARARQQVDEAQAQAVELHRRRSGLSLGPTDDLSWRVPPERAVEELEALHTLGQEARGRLEGLRLP